MFERVRRSPVAAWLWHTVTIAYGSKKLSRREQNWPITKRETYAIAYFLKKYRYYLLGAKKLILSLDDSPIQWLRRAPELTGQNARWFETLEEYKYEFVYRSATSHKNAYAMSRYPYEHVAGHSENADSAVEDDSQEML
jgi:hypothetical protein